MADYSFRYDNYLRNQFTEDFRILLRTAQGRFYFYFQGNPNGAIRNYYYGTRLADGPYNNTTHMRVRNRESNGGDTPVYLTKKQLKDQIITRRKQIQDIRREIDDNRLIYQGRNEQFLREELFKLGKEKEMLEKKLNEREEEEDYNKNNLSPGLTAVDSFDDFEDEKSDIPEQMFVIPPGYRVLFATRVDRYFVNKIDYRGNRIMKLTVNKFMYHVGQEVDAIKFCHIGKKNRYNNDEEDVVKRFMVRPDLALYPVLDVNYWGNTRRVKGYNENRIVTHVQECLEKIKMLRRKIESIVWLPFNDMRNNNRFTQNVKTMCNQNNKKFSNDHYFANRDNRMIWLGDGICSGKLGLLYYWEPVLGTTKFVLKSLNTREGGNAYYYKHMIMFENVIHLINVNIQILMGSYPYHVIKKFAPNDRPGASPDEIMKHFMRNNDLIFRDIGWDASEQRFNSERRGLLQDLKDRFTELKRDINSRKRGRNGNRNDYRYNKRSRNRMLKM